MANSTTTAETYCTVEASNDVVFVRNLLSELDMLDSAPSPMVNDNQGFVVNAHECRIPTSQRHNALKFAIIEELTSDKVVQVWKIKGEDNIADMATKTLFGQTLAKHRAACMGEAEID